MFGWGVKTVSVDQLAEKLKQGKQVLIDVREPNEYKAGHVKGAVNVPLGTLSSAIGRFDPAEETYVICWSGHRSATGAQTLKRAGFKNVYSVAGGTKAWRGNLVK